MQWVVVRLPKPSSRGRSLQERGATILLKCEERLRHALIPRYQQLFTQISRLESGVKFLVDMRTDLLVGAAICARACVCQLCHCAHLLEMCFCHHIGRNRHKPVFRQFLTFTNTTETAVCSLLCRPCIIIYSLFRIYIIYIICISILNQSISSCQWKPVFVKTMTEIVINKPVLVGF